MMVCVPHSLRVRAYLQLSAELVNILIHVAQLTVAQTPSGGGSMAGSGDQFQRLLKKLLNELVASSTAVSCNIMREQLLHLPKEQRQTLKLDAFLAQGGNIGVFDAASSCVLTCCVCGLQMHLRQLRLAEVQAQRMPVC